LHLRRSAPQNPFCTNIIPEYLPREDVYTAYHLRPQIIPSALVVDLAARWQDLLLGVGSKLRKTNVRRPASHSPPSPPARHSFPLSSPWPPTSSEHHLYQRQQQNSDNSLHESGKRMALQSGFGAHTRKLSNHPKITVIDMRNGHSTCSNS